VTPIAGGAPLQAQAFGRVIRGTVLDGRDQPVVSASIVAPGMTATSDDSGRFRISISHRDKVVLEIRRVGFMPTRLSIASGGDTLVSVLLLAAAQSLPGVDVKDKAPQPAGLAGFEERMLARQRGSGTGYFITAREIEKMSPTRSTQIVENVPSISVKRIEGNANSYAIFGKLATGGDCPATVYLDGVRITGMGDMLLGHDRRGRQVQVRGETDSPLDQYVEPVEIAGVEVYTRGLLAPPKFLPTDPNAARCSIVLFWTKHAK